MVAKANTVLKAIEVISIANKSQENSDGFTNKEEENNNSKYQKEETYIPYSDIQNNLDINCPNYTVDINGFSKEVNLMGENFVYEEYISELIHNDSKELQQIYKELLDVTLISLPELVNQAVIVISKVCKERKIYIDENKMYELLFRKQENDLAIKYFKDNISDINLTDEKITKIYNSLNENKEYSLLVVNNKIESFRDLVKLLSV